MEGDGKGEKVRGKKREDEKDGKGRETKRKLIRKWIKKDGKEERKRRE